MGSADQRQRQQRQNMPRPAPVPQPEPVTWNPSDAAANGGQGVRPKTTPQTKAK